ncbi:MULTISPECIES: response regulator [Pseudomonas]|jgi:two-component system KDP operon response regulator KdpE|uniref:response regulator n=1 Tax=Pseudomonas TaxID=286 RepID=UPI000D0D4373|nr:MULTISPECIES: response regulator [Pseudomonas]AZF62946.1 DNA-binding response regulator KdpE [Pseudomonas sp. LBUM920]MBK3510374.1 response regulator [Pseudomonas sp. MF6747]MBT0627441.1 response regulator [Pseudomonas fluorescens]PSL90500.1 DNA-binding response regulator [Pseudomonas sp. R9.37]QJI16449.1 response regulator [Pseudomonas sp. ADAK22]
MSTARILIVEDEANIRRFVGIALQDEGFQVFEADSVKRALIHAASRQPDLVIVDLGLPDGDGKQLISELRGWLAVPILVLSARDREEEKVAALDAGADDYLTKPFGVPELLARIRAQLRRHGQTGTAAATSKVAFGDIAVDLSTHEVWRQGQPVHLTPIEYRLLCAMLRGQSRVLTHRQLLLEVWGLDYIDRPHYLRVHMAHLRQKLEADPAQPQHFITELQVGYRLMGL